MSRPHNEQMWKHFKEDLEHVLNSNKAAAGRSSTDHTMELISVEQPQAMLEYTSNSYCLEGNRGAIGRISEKSSMRSRQLECLETGRCRRRRNAGGTCATSSSSKRSRGEPLVADT